jgi:hypothetical protein
MWCGGAPATRTLRAPPGRQPSARKPVTNAPSPRQVAPGALIGRFALIGPFALSDPFALSGPFAPPGRAVPGRPRHLAAAAAVAGAAVPRCGAQA